MTKIYKDRSGRKLYPVCGFQKNQHKFYYWYEKACNKYYDEETDEAWNDRERKEKWVECATTYIFNGLIYAPWELYNEMKEAIICYDLCH